jgi:AraC-like DNA-binding protein
VKPEGDDLVTTLLEHNLDELMREKRVWMEPHLTLPDLAALVGTNRTYLSNYLNNTLHTTFYDYINGFRMEAALALLNDPDSTLTMVEVAESCGFNSISTFRRVFVRAMGCSYVEYRNRILAEKHPQGEI